MANATQYSTPMTWGVGSDTTSSLSPRISGFGSPKTHWKSAVILGDPPADDPYIIHGIDPKKAAEIAFLQKEWSVSVVTSFSVNFSYGSGSIDLSGSASAEGKALRFFCAGTPQNPRRAEIYSTNKNFNEIFTQREVFDFNDQDGNASNSKSWWTPYSISLSRLGVFSSTIIGGTLSCVDTANRESGSVEYQTNSTALDNRYDPPREIVSTIQVGLSLDKIYFKTDGTCAASIWFFAFGNNSSATTRVFYPSFSATSPPFTSHNLIPDTNFTASILGVLDIPVYVWTNGDVSDINSIYYTLAFDITPIDLWTYS